MTCALSLNLQYVSGCLHVCSLLHWPPFVPPSRLRSDESDQASCASTGPGLLIKNANVSRRVFDAGPRRTKPAKVTEGLCNPLFEARRRETPS